MQVWYSHYCPLLGLGIVVVLLASTVTTLTALSLCAIATNGEVKGGEAFLLPGMLRLDFQGSYC